MAAGVAGDRVGKIGGSEEIRNMLQFMQNSDALAAVDPPTKEMESYVRKVKMDPEVRRRLMTLGDHRFFESGPGRDHGYGATKISA